MQKKQIVAVACCLSLFLAIGGCSVATGPSPETQAPAPAQVAQPAPAPTPAAVEAPAPQKVQKSELELLTDELVAKARTTMRSCKAKYKDMTIEATPLWSFDYQGAVHVRTFDAAGKVIKEEMVQK